MEGQRLAKSCKHTEGRVTRTVLEKWLKLSERKGDSPSEAELAQAFTTASSSAVKIRCENDRIYDFIMITFEV